MPQEEASPVRHGLATFLAFGSAGLLPLAPYLVPGPGVGNRFVLAIVATLVALFGVGSLRASVTDEHWWVCGLEMLALGLVVAATAYAAGALVASIVVAS